MGQKVNPHGLRVGVIKGWDSRWYAPNKDVGDLLVEDYKIRKYLKDTLVDAGIPRIEIERESVKVRIFVHCARVGMVVGPQGQKIEKLRLKLESMIKKPVDLKIIEVKQPEMNAQLVAESIAAQLEKRVSFRRAMKFAMGKSMRLGAKGIKTMVSGRLGGAEIARTEHYHEGTIPLQTLRADIDYGVWEAKTSYGRIGVKVWIYKGEVLTMGNRMGPRVIEAPRPREDRRRDRDDRGRGGRGPRRDDRGPRPQGGGFDRGPRPQGQDRGFGNRPQGPGTGFGNRPQGPGTGFGNRPPHAGPRPAAPENRPVSKPAETPQVAPANPESSAPQKEGGGT
jgi:small subunit ribosomal protein S3